MLGSFGRFSGRFWGRFWRGDVNVWVSMLLISLLATWTLVVTSVSLLSSYTMTSTPYSSIAAATLVGIVTAIFGVWQFVGTWRASAKARAANHWLITRWSARGIALAGLALVLFFLSTMPANFARYYSEANDLDVIGQNPHDVSVEGDQILVSGHMSWGLYDKFTTAMNSNDGLQTVVLNSPGGHYAVGIRMAEQIKARGLDTFTTEMCGSACTYAFLGGHNRYLQRGAKLGYHAPFGNTDVVIANTVQHASAFLRSASVPEPFIAHIFATPGDSVWYPKVSELKEANIITDTVE